MSLLDFFIDPSKICIFSKSSCPYCVKAIELLKNSYNIELQIIDIGTVRQGAQISQELEQTTKQRTVPNIFIFGKHIGGYSHLKQMHLSGLLPHVLKPSNKYVCEFCGKCSDTCEYICKCFPKQFGDWGESR